MTETDLDEGQIKHIKNIPGANIPVKMMHDQYMSTKKSTKQNEPNTINIEFKLDWQLPVLKESMHTENIDNENEEFDINYDAQNYEN